MLIAIDQLIESENRFSSIQPAPVRDTVDDLSEEAFISELPPDIIKGNMLTSEENMQKREEMLVKEAKEPFDFALERAIGKNDSVYTNFIELIIDAKRKVGRIAAKVGNKTLGCATGFMVSDRLMLTNWHVFKTIDSVADSEIQFFYELDLFGNPPGNYVSFKLQSDIFYYSNKQLDYCFVAVSAVDVTGAVNIEEIGYLYLNPSLGKLGNEDEEALNIIHHPNGDFKQLSIRENLFKKITPTTIWYESDTAPGSSGSPVFNDQWQIVALHHMGVAKKNGDGKYIDKDGQIIPVIDGKIDETRVVWEANEGIRISVILKDVLASFPENPLVNSIRSKPGASPGPPAENRIQSATSLTANNINTASMEPVNQGNNVNISFPASLIEANGVINIHINNREASDITKANKQTGTPVEEIDFNEIKRLEESIDLSGCKGYLSSFLGIDVPLPTPKQELKKFLAKVQGTDSVVLKYYHYSVMLHAVRMMPVISAVNVDGDLKKREDETSRDDVWLRDKRIDFDVQLNDQYYRRSGFDRGHMSRREDANWGATPEDAKRNADLTCMYTNACPQVAAINQSRRGGLWGKLEELILEKGAIRERESTRKISVFNGPIFKDTDPVYKGIQVPMSFYKIIFWLTDDGKIKATAFKLSQEDLVGDIDFEQLDIDKNIHFKEYQCSIKSLEEETKLSFSALHQFDTYFGDDGEEMLATSEVDLRKHLERVNRMNLL